MFFKTPMMSARIKQHGDGKHVAHAWNDDATTLWMGDNDGEEKLLTNEEDPSVGVKRILGDLPKVLCEDPRGNVG